ncbi:MAG: rRNA pseudouridine synthase [Demequinaceae bacterium]|nr:rRNA pseudouridine synthase [Demequinaceae bacterium]
MAEYRADGVRLQKVLASAGVGSRRRCEALIAAGRVVVDGTTITDQGMRVAPAEAVITVDGNRIHVREGHLTVVLNKPKGVVSTMSDPNNRPALDTYITGYEARLFHVGRLDADTTGLLLLTNDGDLANRLSHPSHGVSKTYVAKVTGRVHRRLPHSLKKGINLEDGPIAVDSCAVLDATNEFSVVEVTLHEGRNHIVRRMFESDGHPVVELSRTRFGPISLAGLAPGQTRTLDAKEMGALLEEAGL